ncbi:MAG: hypothetical protein ACRCXZ_02310 [Patescibacteria group bacterium]
MLKSINFGILLILGISIFLPMVNVDAQTAQPITTQIQSANCPLNTSFNSTLKVCEDNTNVYGIFTKEITLKCGTSLTCTGKLSFVSINNEPIQLQRYSKTYYTSLAGTSSCPKGSVIYALNSKLCEEVLKNELIGFFNSNEIKYCKIINPTHCLVNRMNKGTYTEVINRINQLGKVLSGTRTFMYHGFEEQTLRNNFMNVSREDFTKQLNWLIDKGFEITTTKKLYQLSLENKLSTLPSKRAIVQIDDGYKSNLIAAKIAKEVSLARNRSVFLELAVVPGTLNKVDSHLSDVEVNTLIAERTVDVVSHTYTHCSLGDEKLLHPTTGTSPIKHPYFAECSYYPAPNGSNLAPLSLEKTLNQLKLTQDYLKIKFNTDIPAVVYPFGHNSTTTRTAMDLLGISYGFATTHSPVCQNDLQLVWKTSANNYTITRSTISGKHSITDPNIWFQQYINAKCI